MYHVYYYEQFTLSFYLKMEREPVSEMPHILFITDNGQCKKKTLPQP
jgi:hypothetical protein